MADYGISEAQFREFLEERLRKASKGEVALAYLEREIIEQALLYGDSRAMVRLIYRDHTILDENPWHEGVPGYAGQFEDFLNQQIYECVQDDVMPVCERLFADAGGSIPEDDPC